MFTPYNKIPSFICITIIIFNTTRIFTSKNIIYTLNNNHNSHDEIKKFLELNKIDQAFFGLHLHTEQKSALEKIESAWNAGCRRFDGAIQGFGGCPMAKDDLTGNMPTEKILSYFAAEKVNTNVNSISFENAYKEASKIFNKYH